MLNINLAQNNLLLHEILLVLQIKNLRKKGVISYAGVSIIKTILEMITFSKEKLLVC